MTQFGVWVTNKPVPFQRHRFANQSEMQEGVVDSGDYKATQRAAGANMSVDVAIGKAWIQVDTGTRNGLGFAYSDAIENIAVSASDATLPRLDQLVLQWNDSSIPTGVGGDVPTLRVIAGVPTSGATLDNRNGAAALPADAVRLLDILVPAASTSVVTANIRDRRPWARGGYVRKLGSNAGNYATSSTASMVSIDATNLQMRMEASGAPLRVQLRARMSISVAGVKVSFQYLQDAVALLTGGPVSSDWVAVGAGLGFSVVGIWEYTPTPGSHLFVPQWQMSAASTGTIVNSGGERPEILVEELVRQNADNL